MNEEYIYDIGKYTIGVDKNGEDGIGLTVAIINDNGEIHLLGSCYGDNARCIDLLIKENKQLKENYECILKQRDDLTKNATEQLEASIEIVKHNRAIQEHIDKERELQNQLQQKEDIINKAKELIYKHIKDIEKLGLRIYPKEYYDLLKKLDNKGDENDG